MKILIVKLTSMGDVLHLMPALTDLVSHHPDAQIDWLVEDSFADIPSWHPAVNRVFKASTRRWRKFNSQARSELRAFKQVLRATEYDVVIDAQGLIKSALISRLAKLAKGGIRAGFSGQSIKESPAAWAYDKKIDVDRKLHAVTRLRLLFAGVFAYSNDFGSSVGADQALNYGLEVVGDNVDNSGTIMLFHGTTWATKHLPDQYWRDLSDVIIDAGFKVKLCWGNEAEHQRAQWIALDRPNATVLPKSSLTTIAKELSSAKGAISVDTGLGHLAAALSVPNVSVYGATDANLTGAVGQRQTHLSSSYACAPCMSKECRNLNAQVTSPPCYDEFPATKIWQSLELQFQ